VHYVRSGYCVLAHNSGTRSAGFSFSASRGGRGFCCVHGRIREIYICSILTRSAAFPPFFVCCAPCTPAKLHVHIILRRGIEKWRAFFMPRGAVCDARRHKAALGSLESSPRPRKNTSCRHRRRARDFLSGDRKSFLVSERKFYILRHRGLSKRNGSCNSSRKP
jgi:hypothetical protein